MHLAACAVLALLAAPTEADRKASARAVLDAMVKNDFAAATKDFDATMKEKMPAAEVEKLWKALTRQLGDFKKVADTQAKAVGGSEAVDQTCEFAKLSVVLRLSFNKEGRIQGLFITPAKPAKFDPPPYARASYYREEDVTVGAGGDWPLPGTLTLPEGKGPHPCVVLVHGSGAHDRDETILTNKPFRDLAWGLGSLGVAVLRYEKRNYAHAAKLLKLKDRITPQEEVIDDVLAAVKLVRKHKEVGAKRVFVLGHSLGATVAPRVGELDADLGGLILLAGNTRPLEDLILEQFTYLYSLEGALTDEHKADLAELKKKVLKVKEGKLTKDVKASELPLNIPAAYWKALSAYDQAATAAKVKVPMLVLQGERDYQVTMEDFAGWKKALGGRKDVTLKSYANLNHLFQEGKGKSKPDEYLRAGHVAAEVVEDIAAWVKKR